MSVADLAEARKRRKTPPPPGDDPRPVIQLKAGEMSRTVDAVEAVLSEAWKEGPIFQRGGQPVHIADRPVRRLDGSTDRQHAIAGAGADAVLEQMDRAVRFEKFDVRAQSWKPSDAPRRLAEVYYARPRWEAMPALRQLIACPTLRPDGSLIERAGYDAATGLYLTTDLPGLDVPAQPTRDQAEAANDALVELLRDFPFVNDPPGLALSVALAGLLAAILRPTLDAAPLIGISAPAAGSGKSYLVDVISTIVTGRRAAGVATGNAPEEFEKSLGAAMLEGRPLLVLDNVELPLGGQLLCMTISQASVAVRILGQSRAVDVPSTAAWFATGNSLRVAGDMKRRALICRLDAQLEHPEEREFDVDLLAEARRRRAELVSASLTIARWASCDPPPPGRPFAGFGDWCLRVRDPLLALGHADPVDVLDEVRAGDIEAARLAELLAAWRDALGDKPTTCAALVSSEHEGLREALQALASRGGTISSRGLGNYLGKHEGRIAGGLRVIRAGQHEKTIRWAVREAG